MGNVIIIEALDTDTLSDLVIEAEDLLVHKGFNYSKIEYALKELYPDLVLVAVNPGTEAYTKYGFNCSYVQAI